MIKNISKERIGNIILYLSERIEELSLTKTLKLLYLIDEYAVKETGVPITWLDYKVWKLGPVPELVYNELSTKNNDETRLELEKYINVKREEKNIKGDDKLCTYLLPKDNFDDQIFSDYEIELFDRIIQKFGKMNSEQIIEILHQEGTLWDKKVKEENLRETFEILDGKSNVSIEFTDLVKDALKRLAYKSAYEAFSF